MKSLVDNAEETRKLMNVLKAQGMSPADIAAHMNVTLRTVYRWQKGDTGPRSSAVWNRLEELRGDSR